VNCINLRQDLLQPKTSWNLGQSFDWSKQVGRRKAMRHRQ